MDTNMSVYEEKMDDAKKMKILEEVSGLDADSLISSFRDGHRLVRGLEHDPCTISLSVVGPINNISLALAIYNLWKSNPRLNEDIDLEIISEILQTQIMADRKPRLYSTCEGREYCE